MKLAEGLVLRADTRKRIEQLRERLKLSALVQEGEAPAEDPQELLAELQRLLSQMTELVQRINRTNLQAALPDGRTLTTALAERDTMTLHHNVLQTTVEAATPKVDRLGRAEIKKIPTVKIAELRRRMDEVARERRELDTLIQSMNWTTELLD
ncbi:MAG: DIP1984 family protein [Armatimonadetes bacterium]|nr:DIP1984 family protein [Armatimonadota bacterium]